VAAGSGSAEDSRAASGGAVCATGGRKLLSDLYLTSCAEAEGRKTCSVPTNVSCGVQVVKEMFAGVES
jgi:hypothetical protein